MANRVRMDPHCLEKGRPFVTEAFRTINSSTAGWATM